ncbi:hypothetical protein IT084_07305 [Desulfallas sp. Bu1-1]|uniref:hypothetical protein n=1 Tax=Desulfallas sp. Bu1-1 TaxID=2787620 RepID=UPI00189DA329|nr:hypothetical protein [Desulfallas sp. Bu1-1]MBF7082786.1 hypothetical protein [Desulfallas sp. Bu1-1]
MNKKPEEAKKQQLTRQVIIQKLEQTLKTAGPKALLGNRGYQRYLKMDKKAVTINEEAVKEDAKYDGKYILRTNCDLPPDEIALGYKGLWQVERAFRSLKRAPSGLKAHLPLERRTGARSHICLFSGFCTVGDAGQAAQRQQTLF